MRKILIANWKMNPVSELEAIQLAKVSDAKGVVVCPPFIFLNQVRNVLKVADLGAQDVFWENPIPGGAFTGEISVSMLKKAGVSHVIIGHSERRRHLRETDGMINKKFRAAIAFGLKVILCVGEPLAVRKQGLAAAKTFVRGQLLKDLESTRNLKIRHSNFLVAYEPIWAIGTGKPDKPEESAAMAVFIKSILFSKFQISGSRVLYGGSVTSGNVDRILKYDEIDGALVGGASLKPKEFEKIIQITENI